MERAREPDVGSPPIDDLWARAIGIPAFGIAIPLVFGLYGPVAVSSPLAWLGQLLFLGLSFAIWHGNRHLLFATADRFDWLERPWLRVGRLALGILLFTAPLTIAVLAAWSRLSGAATLDVDTTMAVVLTNVICVVFVAHVYETVLLVKQREADRVRVARAERARVESELLALRRQIDPHFLFNCLNTMQSLVAEDPARALRFNGSLAAMLRYLLYTSDRHVVPLAEELAFAERYAELSALRFGEAFRLEVTQREGWQRTGVPPTSLQLLVENALAHNSLSTRMPLVVHVELDADGLSVWHAHRPRGDARGAGIGLTNLAERVRLAYGGSVSIDAGTERFAVRVSSARSSEAPPPVDRATLHGAAEGA